MTHAVGSNRPYTFPTATPEGSAGVTQITITPDSNPPPGAAGFFGEDGLTFGDLVDAVNPLNHIPFVSKLFHKEGAPEEKPSVASKLVGGALLGGPVGLVASLANVIFEEATGKGVAEAAYAALSGETPEVQVAAADAPAEAEVASAEDGPAPMQLADATPAPRPEIDIRSLENATAALQATRTKDLAMGVMQHGGALAPAAAKSSLKGAAQAKALLELYGASAAPASKAYQNAQMLPFLRQASTNQVL